MENKYQKVKDALREAILAGEYAIDEKLPTESEFVLVPVKLTNETT